jgi:hypothetical protein
MRARLQPQLPWQQPSPQLSTISDSITAATTLCPALDQSERQFMIRSILSNSHQSSNSSSPAITEPSPKRRRKTENTIHSTKDMFFFLSSQGPSHLLQLIVNNASN